MFAMVHPAIGLTYNACNAIPAVSCSTQGPILMAAKTLLSLSVVLSLLCWSGCTPGKPKSKAEARPEKPASTNPVVTAAQNVRSQLKKIQAHGEVDIEVMSQINAIHDSYSKFLDAKSKPPANWIELASVGALSGVVQEAERAGAYVRFGVTTEQLSSEEQKATTLIAIKSLNDGSIWALQFGGDVVRISEEEFQALTPQ